MSTNNALTGEHIAEIRQMVNDDAVMAHRISRQTVVNLCETVDALRSERDRWRDDFQATEKTARELDEQWERLRLILGITDEIDDDDFAWSELVDRVEARIRNSNRIVALLVALKHDREITRFPAYAEEIRCVLAALVIQPARLRAIEAAHLAEAGR